MFQGTCEKCGDHYFGNALQSVRYRICPKCGGNVALLNDKPVGKTASENCEDMKRDLETPGT